MLFKDMNDKLKPLLQKEFYGKTEYNKSGKLETLELCSKDNLEECGMGFKRLTPYVNYVKFQMMLKSIKY